MPRPDANHYKTNLVHDARTTVVRHVVVLADLERLFSIGKVLEHGLVLAPHQLGTLDDGQLCRGGIDRENVF